jgi:tripartite-type tricarboxylate transporter receptor subunit TctC
LPRASAASIVLISGAIAQVNSVNWPDRSVRIIAPFPAGGSVDVLVRILAE